MTKKIILPRLSPIIELASDGDEVRSGHLGVTGQASAVLAYLHCGVGGATIEEICKRMFPDTDDKFRESAATRLRNIAKFAYEAEYK